MLIYETARNSESQTSIRLRFPCPRKMWYCGWAQNPQAPAAAWILPVRAPPKAGASCKHWLSLSPHLFISGNCRDHVGAVWFDTSPETGTDRFFSSRSSRGTVRRATGLNIRVLGSAIDGFLGVVWPFQNGGFPFWLSLNPTCGGFPPNTSPHTWLWIKHMY